MKNIRKTSQFRELKRYGERHTKKFFDLVFVESEVYDKSDFGLAVIVSRKVGDAVKRNKIRRWIKEYFRKKENNIPCGLNYLVITKTGIFEYGYKNIWKDLADVIEKCEEHIA